MSVRCKMRVMSKTDEAAYDPTSTQRSSSRVRLSAVYGAGNESFAKATPSASLEMTIDNKSALDFFKIGTCYYLDFSEAPQQE